MRATDILCRFQLVCSTSPLVFLVDAEHCTTAPQMSLRFIHHDVKSWVTIVFQCCNFWPKHPSLRSSPANQIITDGFALLLNMGLELHHVNTRMCLLFLYRHLIFTCTIVSGTNNHLKPILGNHCIFHGPLQVTHCRGSSGHSSYRQGEQTCKPAR